jgi:hypothetical protein
MVLHTTLDGSWKPLYTCMVSFLFPLVLTCILVACFDLVSCLCINHGRLATLFIIALWSCIPILPSFVWYFGRWYLWTSCHALSLFLYGYVMLFIHIIFYSSMVSSLVSVFALWYILVVDPCELVWRPRFLINPNRRSTILRMVKSRSTWVLTSKNSPTNSNGTFDHVDTHVGSTHGQSLGQTPLKL